MQRYLKIIFLFFGLLFFTGSLKIYAAVPTESSSVWASGFASVSADHSLEKGTWEAPNPHWIWESEAAASAPHSGTPSSRLKRMLAFKMLNSLKSFVRDISFWEDTLIRHFQRLYTTSVVRSTEFISKYYVFAYRQIII